MSKVVDLISKESPENRSAFIAQSFTDNYKHLMDGDASAWRGKFRKMA